MAKLLIVTETRYLCDIDEAIDVQEKIIHNGSLIEITKTADGFKITNGIDGHGNNLREDYANAKIYITP